MMTLRALLAFSACLFLGTDGVLGADPDFNREIRPILAGRCYKCHGPDEGSREAGLRLDTPAGAALVLESGSQGIHPGQSAKSGVIERANSADADLRMPPPSEGPPLTAGEIDLLKRWIDSGAGYARHWSYEPPVSPPLPGVSRPDWCAGPIDRFILARLDAEKLQPQHESDPATLLRRVTLDLSGLPPTIEETEAFLADPSMQAYEQVVDRLLASPSFGERFGRTWLDLARYADSAGYADDPPRVIWRYRDWVIAALNSGMPFDQFTIEQIAGDMLPEATDAQRIATGFHRNTMTNSEGGTDDEEFRNVAVVDRVNTTMQTWMATTIMCAQCHTHKYDPITQAEYFQVFAILNQTEDADRRDETPVLSMLTPEQEARRKSLQDKLAAAEKKADEIRQATPGVEIPEGPITGRYVRIELPGKEKILSLAEVEVFVGGSNQAQGKTATQSSTDYEGPPGLAVDGNTDGRFTEARSTSHTAIEDSPWWEVDLGESLAIERVVLWNRTDSTDVARRLNGARLVVLDAERRPRWVKPLPKAPLKEGAYPVPESGEKLSKADRDALVDVLAESNPKLVQARAAVRSLRREVDGILPITTPIMRELPPEKQRKTRIHIRGNFLDLGDEVGPGTPAVFPSSGSSRPDRLEFARWLVSRDNPLTARVLVNRLWEQLFGIGLVETSEEFGLQGDLPSHPELLDWLAVEVMDRGWNTKQLIRLIVTSSTYRQSSTAPAELVARDPNNRLLARGPRFRLEAELVRDHALFAAGLLSRKMEGPSAKPPRPRLGLTAAFGGSTDWEASQGEDRYRRGIYTYWQRSIPYPSMDTFDAPNREVCTVRRTRTNTPLQALVTLNDPVYIEAAQTLARKVLTQGTASQAPDDLTRERIAYAFRTCATRSPSTEEVSVLADTLERIRSRYRSNPEAALQMATPAVGEPPAEAEIVDVAAWTVLSNVLLNLDETLTRR
ncbi:Planctomycete cytochrome C [Caulifigura coniformis]|uniref:Planctomycete cytochrome C n=1 Tax=Caulifigura coniformis TaxID=2527983 RepID=A0A517SLG6_9PLAN|nr:DUF1553 domain-containing protein [Caulifigura coniformis]QDT56964.1 Planctomycete cytochrome C [Caulifigura coniformis]